MPLPRAPLLLLKVVLAYIGRGRSCGSPSRSLCYSYLQLSEPSEDLSPTFIRGYLDGQPIARYDSLTKKMEPLVPWMKEVEKVEQDETFLVLEWVFGTDLEKLSKLSQQTGGLHTWQVAVGCLLREDGSKGGFLHYGYDGWDFISFDKETLRWVAAQPQAAKVKEKWEVHPGQSQRKKTYLEETCIKQLQSYQSYKKKAHQRTEPPVGKVTRKVVDDSLETLTCQAYGFYPREIQATWRRDGEVCEYETLHGNVAPNSDGTHYVWLSIDIDPQERDRFRCHLEHEALQEPLVLAWEEETATLWWIPVALVAAIILGAGILFLRRLCFRYRNQVVRKVKSYFDYIPSEMAASPPIDDIEDGIRSQAMLQTKATIEHTPPCEAQGLKNGLKDSESILPRQEGKQQRLRSWSSWAGDLERPLQILAEAGATESGERVTKEPMESPGVSEEFSRWQSMVNCKLNEDGHQQGMTRMSVMGRF